MEKFAEALREELAKTNAVELTEEEALQAVQDADQNTDPGVFASVTASHTMLDMVGVPREYPDGSEASLDARLAALVRGMQGGGASAGGGCGSCGTGGCG